MKCLNCQADNESAARFCAECGGSLQHTTQPRAVPQVYCPKCGKTKPTDSAFCRSCGNRLTGTKAPAASATRPARPAATAPAMQPVAVTQQQPKPTSWAWWLLPIILVWVGGIIGFVVVRENDKKKANGLLILGIIMTFVWPLFWMTIFLILGRFGVFNF